MDVYKTKPGINESIEISEDNLDLSFNKRYPYYQKGKNGKDYYYAVCPLCDNPIQIIGLYKKQENATRPFGKHNKGTVIGVAEYSEEDYLNCPFHNSNYNSDTMRPISSDTANSLLKYLLSNYDLLIDKLSKDIGIKISFKFAMDLLNAYITNEGWRYYESTYGNISFMLLYAEPAFTLINRHIRKDSKISKILFDLKDVFLESYDDVFYIVKAGNNQFVQLQARICNHKCRIVKEHKIETFMLVLNYKGKDIYKEEMVVDDGVDLTQYEHNGYLLKEVRNNYLSIIKNDI